MDTVVFFVILGSVVAVALYQMRQRESAPTPVLPAAVEQPVAPAPSPSVETPLQLIDELARRAPPPLVETTVVTPTPEPTVAPPGIALAEAPKRKRSRKTPAQPKPTSAASSSVALVLAMLKKRESLAAAFVLREIFGAPVSRRRR